MDTKGIIIGQCLNEMQLSKCYKGSHKINGFTSTKWHEECLFEYIKLLLSE